MNRSSDRRTALFSLLGTLLSLFLRKGVRRRGSRSIIRSMTFWLRFVIVIAIFGAGWVWQKDQNPSYENIRVTRVFDGDTIELANGNRIRLLGIDCPERHENDKLYRDAYKTKQNIQDIMDQGEAAHRFTTHLLQEQSVLLKFDKKKKDRYGRWLAYVYLSDGTFVNAAILKAGYARPLLIAPNLTYEAEFNQIYEEAQRQGRGLWKKKDRLIEAKTLRTIK